MASNSRRTARREPFCGLFQGIYDSLAFLPLICLG
jgi:hypothetical protein